VTPELLAAAGWGLLACAVLAALTWVASLPLRDVSIADIAWGWLVVAPGLVAAAVLAPGPRALPVLAIAVVWAVRLSLYIAARHLGQPEDHRYQAIRARNQPGFEFRSLYLVFGLQALLGWIVSAPLVASVASRMAWNALDTAGAALALFGFASEAVADAQLARFKSDPANRGRVMDRGLWRYSRHPNYFGEFCTWWGLGLVAVAGGAAWALVSPLVMSVLLLRVSGVTLLEAAMPQRRPGYAEYARRTNAFFPWSPRA
jgi:steroid 5-alpha reductase family enzyme